MSHNVLTCLQYGKLVAEESCDTWPVHTATLPIRVRRRVKVSTAGMRTDKEGPAVDAAVAAAAGVGGALDCLLLERGAGVTVAMTSSSTTISSGSAAAWASASSEACCLCLGVGIPRSERPLLLSRVLTSLVAGDLVAGDLAGDLGARGVKLLTGDDACRMHAYTQLRERFDNFRNS
jgi:hypothetical protein